LNITIYRAHSEELVKQNLLPQLMDQLPISLHDRALRYRSPLSAYHYVIGRLLLSHGLAARGHETDLETIEFSESGKPTLKDIHFNISHSDHQVVCAFANEGELGIDIERITPIDFEDFASMFSMQEWAVIRSSDDPLGTFYWYWTRKESIIKACGLSLGYMHQIELDVAEDYFDLGGQRWFLRDVDFGQGIAGAVCCAEEIGEIGVLEIVF